MLLGFLPLGIFSLGASIKLHASANSETESGWVFKGENREESVAGQRRFNKISLSYGLASFKEYRSAYLPGTRFGEDHGKYLFRRSRT